MEELKSDDRPVSWLDDLTGLIQRKKAENEVLKKIYSDMLPEGHLEIIPEMDDEKGMDKETQV